MRNFKCLQICSAWVVGEVFRAWRQCCIRNSIGSDEKLLDFPGIRSFRCASRAWDLYISVHIAHSACWELHSGAPTKYRSLTLPVQARPSGAVLLHWPSARSVCHFRMWWMTAVTSTEIFHTSVSPITATWETKALSEEKQWPHVSFHYCRVALITKDNLCH